MQWKNNEIIRFTSEIKKAGHDDPALIITSS